MIFIVVTQHTLKRALRGQGQMMAGLKQGARDFFDGMIAGAQNMIGIGVATGAAGIIIGTVSLTGAHQVIGEFVEFLSGGNLMLMLFLVAVMSLILGMGLPTTANYIVVSSLMAPVIVMVGAQSGLIVPLIAVHLFVFYFGILADDTPPVGLAAFAAAAISRGDPIRTGIQGFSYDIRTAILPFMFIFNTDILLINVSFFEGFVTTITIVLAMLVFCSAIQNYIIVKNKFYETLLLLLVAFSLFRPDFWLDKIQSPYKELPGNKIFKLIDGYTNTSNVSKDTPVRIKFSGPDFDDPERIIFQNSVIKLTNKGTVDEILKKAGLFLKSDDDNVLMEEPLPGSPLFQQMKTFDFYD